MANLLDLDPRWRALTDPEGAFGGVIDIGFDHPSEWLHEPRGDQPFVKAGEDQLASELCRLGNKRYLRATLALPIRGSDEALMVALWAEVPHPAFYAYLELLDGGPVPAETPASLANDLSPMAALNSAVTLTFGDGAARPQVEAIETKEISLDQLLDLYEATGTLDRSALKPT
ncbi:hypothetical protein CEW89_07330 [Celeribacter ethanolicus]|uniref:DUF2199 domain-containing protein n=1 Tax=Celeribacter ethanolicus TaxID=1758178 RepID=A0A291GB26_9RHOB|nr:DUF2199 domain-containing protein [Celeribacter ethanolicus]ATG47395.1 hypothetical protein CEW89_07330 [Celeribacter ethanolicus]